MTANEWEKEMWKDGEITSGQTRTQVSRFMVWHLSQMSHGAGFLAILLGATDRDSILMVDWEDQQFA